MKPKRILALLLTGALALQCTTALAATPTGISAVKSRTTISSNSLQTAEALSLNVQKAYTFNGSDEYYYKFTPSVTDYYEVKVENVVENDTFIFVRDSAGEAIAYGTYNQLTKTTVMSGTQMTAGSTYYIDIVTYIDGEASRTMVTTVSKHEHTGVPEYGKEPSCNDAGFQFFNCTTCGNTYEVHVPKKPHTWETTYTIDSVQSCTQDGQKSFHCSFCDEVNTESVIVYPAWGHDYQEHSRSKANRDANGKIRYICERCNAEKITTISRPKKITLSKTSYVYDGKTKKPTLKVTDAAGETISASRYTVSYASGRKNAGRYKVTVRFRGSKYEGSMSTYFTIIPKASTLTSVTASSKGFTARWKKQSTQTTGYQLQYATNSKFKSAKTITFVSNKTTSRKVTKLSAKKKYYVRVRTYKTVSGKKYYSKWSAVKTVTTKK